MFSKKGNKMQAQVGSVVKTFDFPGHTDCYMIGLVTKVEQGLLHLNTIKRVMQGKELAAPATYQTPVQGASFMDASFERVVVLA